MKKFVMALSILAMGGSALVGVLNKTGLEEEIVLLETTKKTLTKVVADLRETEDNLATAQETEKQSKNARDQVAANVSETEQNLNRTTAQIEGTSKELADAQLKKKEIDLAIRKLFPDGNIKTVDDVRRERKMQQDALAEKQNNKSELEAQLASVQTERGAQETRVKQGEAHQIKRAQGVALNGLEATVIAVNRNWGFVMVNTGKNYGVSAESSLLVKRGNERVARLRIVSLEPSMVVCDIIPESLVAGTKISPGDKVIFENTK